MKAGLPAAVRLVRESAAAIRPMQVIALRGIVEIGCRKLVSATRASRKGADEVVVMERTKSEI